LALSGGLLSASLQPESALPLQCMPVRFMQSWSTPVGLRHRRSLARCGQFFTRSLPAVGQFCCGALLFCMATQSATFRLTVMRLWSLHPKYLDAKGLVALWREALLAKAVLCGATRGYIHHPQLERFREHPHSRSAINAYLAAIQDEATARGYNFNRAKVGPVRAVPAIAVTSGQLAYEWHHLRTKLAVRSPAVHARWSELATPACHPLFRRKPGPVASWERVSSGKTRRSVY